MHAVVHDRAVAIEDLRLLDLPFAGNDPPVKVEIGGELVHDKRQLVAQQPNALIRAGAIRAQAER